MYGRERMKNNDIANLEEALRLSRLSYVDCSGRQELQRVLRRWPLLAELAATRRGKP